MTEDLLGQVAVTLRQAPAPLSAAELGDALGVSRVTVRRYAEHLVESGRARRGYRRHPGSGAPRSPRACYESDWCGFGVSWRMR